MVTVLDMGRGDIPLLTELHLTNFRGFEDHTIPLRQTTIMVGRNNAGKSSAVEALRLVSIVTERLPGLAFSQPHRELGVRHVGVRPSLRQSEVNFKSIGHNYAELPAVIKASFCSGATISIYLFWHTGRKSSGPEGVMHAVIRDPQGRIASSRKAASQCSLGRVSILPQVAPVAREEKALAPGYVRSAMSSSLAPLHFRNQLKLLYDDYFDEFKKLAESNWTGLRIRELEGRTRLFPGSDLNLLVQDGDFVGELAWMGHGLQMWLQTMWFLARTPKEATVILDEPDVYMHADLQRRLIRLLRGRHRQTIIATHSIEIMEEVEPEEIVVIDRSTSRSLFADSLPAVQSAVDGMGGIQNVHLTRLWTAKRFILVEGKDLALLKRFQNKLYPQSPHPFDAMPHMAIGGWGNWPWAIGSALGLRNAVGENLVTYCILDSDYHCLQAIAERYKQAEERGIELHIWFCKEIENYLLVPSTIKHLIQQRIALGTQAPSEEEIAEKIDEIAAGMEERVFDGLSTEILSRDRRLGSGGANRKAREVLTERKDQHYGLRGVVSGKEVLSALSSWSRGKFGVSFGSKAVASALRIDEVPQEVRDVVSAIEQGEPLRQLARPYQHRSGTE